MFTDPNFFAVAALFCAVGGLVVVALFVVSLTTKKNVKASVDADVEPSYEYPDADSIISRHAGK